MSDANQSSYPRITKLQASMPLSLHHGSKFWDHYLHGSVTSNETNKPEVHLGEDATLDERLKFLIMSKSGKRCSERNKKERRENGSAARMRRTMKDYAMQHATMQDDLLRILKASDHARQTTFANEPCFLILIANSLNQPCATSKMPKML